MMAFLQSNDAAYTPQQVRNLGGGVKVEPESRNIYRAEVEAFSEALLEGKPNVLSGTIGVHSQKVIAACYESAKSGKAIRVEGNHLQKATKQTKRKPRMNPNER